MSDAPERGGCDLDEVAAALDATGLNWTNRGAAWVAPAGEGVPCGLRVKAAEGGAEVEAVLVEWDKAEAECDRALSRFLALAQTGLNGCRAERDQGRARVVARVARGQEAELVQGVRGVAAACRGLARAARALLIPELARAYLAFHGAG
jgi:hypothetical protein